MKSEQEFPFVCVHLRGEKSLYGQMYGQDDWSITVRCMTSNSTADGYNVQINQREVEMIENMDIKEAPWNETDA